MSTDEHGSTGAIAVRLRRALDSAEDDEARYQLREALQLCVDPGDAND